MFRVLYVNHSAKHDSMLIVLYKHDSNGKQIHFFRYKISSTYNIIIEIRYIHMANKTIFNNNYSWIKILLVDKKIIPRYIAQILWSRNNSQLYDNKMYLKWINLTTCQFTFPSKCGIRDKCAFNIYRYSYIYMYAFYNL